MFFLKDIKKKMEQKDLALDAASKRLLATVGGMKIYSNSIYVITGKMDEEAPTGYQDRGISKTPFPGNKTVSCCSWDKALRVYDTGFFINSACYKGYSTHEKKSEMEMRIKNIRIPFEESANEDLDQKNFDFWDTYQIDLYDGRLFYTNDVRDLFELYISILSKSLTPKEEDGNPLYVESYYCVEDKTTAVDIKRQRQIDKADILYRFMDMMKGSEEEKQNMYDLLLYLDIIKSVDLDPSMVQYIFTDWIDRKNTNVDMFKDALRRFIDASEEENGSQIIKFHRMIREMIEGMVISINADGLYLNSENIGADAISASMDIVSNKSMLETKSRVLEAYNALKNKHKKIESKGEEVYNKKKKDEPKIDVDQYANKKEE